jgi:hypothetical protein
MKKCSGVLAFFVVMFSSLVSAGPVDGARQLLEGAREIAVIVIQFVGDMILDANQFDEFLFVKILLFALVFMVVYGVLKNNEILSGDKTINMIIAVAISIMSVRYLPDNFIQAIMLQYGALAVGITTFIPLVIFFYFLHQSNIGPFGRRFGWIIYLGSFSALWFFRHEDLGAANWIYYIAIGFAVLSIMFDKTIHEYLGLSGFRKARKARRIERSGDARARLQELEKNRSVYTDSEYKILRKKFEKIIKNSA